MAGRGTGWVVAQFVLLALVVLAAVVSPRWPDGWRAALAALGAALLVGGGIVAAWAGRALGSALTPFPRPSATGTLVAAGPYVVVRHPIYAGGLLFVLGVSFLAGPLTLVPAVCLAVLWARKAEVEEAHLDARYGADWTAYAARVRWRLVPGVY